MSQLWVDAPDVGSNRPGGAVCPRWLLLLDDPDPKRIVVIGDVAPGLLEWFGERGADVERRPLAHGRDTSSVRPADAAVDLVVVGHDPAGEQNHRHHSRSTAAVRAQFPASVAVADLGSSPTSPMVVHTEHAVRLIGHTSGTVVSHDPCRPARDFTPASVRASSTAPPPTWLQAAVRRWAPESTSWSLRIPDDYPSQKAVARIDPRPGSGRPVIVKVTRHPRFNGRLDNEFDHLRKRSEAEPDPFGPDRRAPVALGTATVAGLRAVVETAEQGRPFLDVSRLGSRCQLAEEAARTIIELSTASGQRRPGDLLAGSLDQLFGRFVDRFDPEPDVVTYLQRQIVAIGRAELPLVLFHGDLGTWNLLAASGKVVVLDWESAVDSGPPLWDLAYFFRSYAVRSGRRHGLRRDAAISRHLLGTSRLNAVGARWFATYRAALGIDAPLGAALFHTSWMHRAVKESLRLPAGSPGHYGPLCRRLVLRRGDPGLHRLLGR